MRGVDRADQNIILYIQSEHRGKKLYFPLCAHCLDLATQNALQLHNISGGKLDKLT